MSSTIVDGHGWKPAFGNPRNISNRNLANRHARRKGVAKLHNEGKTVTEIARELGGYSVDLITQDLAEMGVQA